MELPINEWSKIADPNIGVELLNTGNESIAICFCAGHPQSDRKTAKNFIALNSDDHYTLGVGTEAFRCEKTRYSLYARPLGGLAATLTVRELEHCA